MTLPPRTPTMREPPDYAAMSGPEFLAAVRDDAWKWADAFHQIIVARGVPIDEELMVGWFANAIEHSETVRRNARAALAAEESGWLPTHRHYKGGLYRVLGNAVHTEDGTELVAYEDQDRFIWVRPRAMFNEKMPDGRLRFSPLPPPPSPKEPR